MLCFKNNISVRKYFLKLLLLIQNIIIVGVLLLAKVYQLLSTGDGEGDWEIQGTEAHRDLPQKMSGAGFHLRLVLAQKC